MTRPLIGVFLVVSLVVACGCTRAETTTSVQLLSTAASGTSTTAAVPRLSTTTSAESTQETSASDSQYFSDISSSPYKEAIEALAEAGVIGIMGDSSDDSFRPSDSVVRAEFARMIVLGLGLHVAEGETPLTFRDVERPEDSLYPDDYVAVAAANGLIQGYPDGDFRPYLDITRAQLLSIIVRACDRQVPSPIQEPPESWIGLLPAGDPSHGVNIARAEYSDLLAGIDLEAFDIDGKVTRGEIAQMIWNLRQKWAGNTDSD